MKATLKSGRMKHELRFVPTHAKKLQSKYSRRRRSTFSHILCNLQMPIDSDTAKIGVSMPLNSSCSYRFVSETSCNSSGLRDEWKSVPSKKRVHDQTKDYVAEEDDPYRRVTRKYFRENEKKMIRGVTSVELEASESCAESTSVAADVSCFEDRTMKLKSAPVNRADITKIEEMMMNSEASSRSEITCVEQFCTSNDELSLQVAEKTTKWKKINEIEDEVSFTSQLALSTESKFHSACSSISKLVSDQTESGVNENRRVIPPEISQFSVSDTTHHGSDLLCTELLSSEEFSDNTSILETTCSDNFSQNSEADTSEYSPSVWPELLDLSGSDFSEGSQNQSAPSPTFLLFLQYSGQFTRLSSPLAFVTSLRDEEECKTEFTLMRFVNHDEEDSYQLLRNRERRQSAQSYAGYYHNATECANPVLQQRLHMVHWIVEQSVTKDLRSETLFLAVNLLDRFLCEGFFTSNNHLQIVGIACLVLASRIEENQPYNTVQEKTFIMGSNVYTRCEVIAMEWFVQKVLNFQCFTPTIHSFLWFYLKAAKATAEVEKRAEYLALLVLLDHEQLRFWTSSVAAGIVILASLAANQDLSCQRVMETHVRTKEDDLPECIKSLEWLVKYAC